MSVIGTADMAGIVSGVASVILTLSEAKGKDLKTDSCWLWRSFAVCAAQDDGKLLLLRRRLCCGRSAALSDCGVVEALDHRVGNVDGIRRVNQTRLELVEDRRDTH